MLSPVLSCRVLSRRFARHQNNDITINILAVEREALRAAHVKKNVRQATMADDKLFLEWKKNCVVAIIYHAAKTDAELISNIVVLVTKESEF